MTDLLRLVVWLRAARAWTVVAMFLGVAVVASNTGLLAVATYLVSTAALHPPLVALVGALALVRVFGLPRGFFRYAERMVSHDVTFRLLARVRLSVFGRLMRLSTGQLLALRSADLLARLVRDVDEMENLFQHLIAPLGVAVLTFVVVVGAVWLVDASMAAVVAASLGIVGLGIPVASALGTRSLHARLVQQRADLDIKISDALSGMVDVSAFGHGEVVLAASDRISRMLERGQKRLALIAGCRLATQDAAVRFGAWTLLLLAIPLVNTHVFEAAYVAVFPVVLLGVAEAFEPLAQAAQRLPATRAAAARILAVGDRPPALATSVAVLAEAPAGRSLTFERVGLTYDAAPVVSDVSFAVRRGEAIGIVGPSGAGKSSLLQLAARAWDPAAGRVLLDGRDLRTLSTDTLTSRIGLLTHEGYIFAGTVRENLQLARPAATDPEMYAALEAVELSHALNAEVGEHGARLSGGERQRLAIARMLLLEAPFLLFDEPTANLDPQTEGTIMRVIRSLAVDRGVLLVTHRLVDLEWLDELLVLDAGRIVERGTPADLRHAGGLYARLVRVQQDMLTLA